ncbi:hypothetical protein HCH_00900 [Hahella chejuensis KCTC 2396]|uniref:Uncharacterized protein n=1 Tax=Hahella chejuensis (strain KCTC 2396) TaxID=349521 RepID=Q2SNI3_HAHCH|nr:hypothetical protein [Hahella chejuensis]ABC27791.1 hypothetical protein HCH_00900 [Hahella chejuensis KCTC 2396]
MPPTIIKPQFSQRLVQTFRSSLIVSLFVSLQGCAVSWWSSPETTAPPEDVSQLETTAPVKEASSDIAQPQVASPSEVLQNDEAQSTDALVEAINSPPPAAGPASEARQEEPLQLPSAEVVVEGSVATPAHSSGEISPATQGPPQQTLAMTQVIPPPAEDLSAVKDKTNEHATKEDNEEAGSLKAVEVKAQPASIKRSTTTAALSQNIGSFGIWTLERNWDGEHPDRCRLSTPTRQVEIGDHTSQIWLSLEPGRFVVYASSDIFLKKRGVGLRLDQSKLMSFSQQDYPTRSLVLSDITDEIEKSKMLHVYLVLGEQKSSLSHQEFSLQDMRKAIPALKRCNS